MIKSTNLTISDYSQFADVILKRIQPIHPKLQWYPLRR